MKQEDIDDGELEENMKIVHRTLKNIRDVDVELFLHFCHDNALQIVSDLLDDVKPSQKMNAIDRETKNFAARIKKSPHFKFYKQLLLS